MQYHTFILNVMIIISYRQFLMSLHFAIPLIYFLLLPATGDEIVINIMKLDHNYFFNQNKPRLMPQVWKSIMLCYPIAVLFCNQHFWPNTWCKLHGKMRRHVLSHAVARYVSYLNINNERNSNFTTVESFCHCECLQFICSFLGLY